MKLLTSIVNQIPEFQKLQAAIDSGACPAVISGLAPIHRAHFAAALWQAEKRPVVIVCADEREGERFCADLAAFTGVQAALLTSREFVFHESAAISRQWEHKRLSVMNAMLNGQAPLVVATVEALLQRTIPKKQLSGVRFTLDSTGSYDLNELAERLSAAGYSRRVPSAFPPPGGSRSFRISALPGSGNK